MDTSTWFSIGMRVRGDTRRIADTKPQKSVLLCTRHLMWARYWRELSGAASGPASACFRPGSRDVVPSAPLDAANLALSAWYNISARSDTFRTSRRTKAEITSYRAYALSQVQTGIYGLGRLRGFSLAKRFHLKRDNNNALREAQFVYFVLLIN